MNFIKSSFFNITLLTTMAMGMDPAPQPINPEKVVVNHLYKVTPKGEGMPCYLMGTQHVNGDVSDKVINFVTTNLSQVYFEKCYADEFDDIAARFFANAYLEAQHNMKHGEPFILPSNLDQSFQSAISAIEDNFQEIDNICFYISDPEEAIKSFLNYHDESINEEREREKSIKNRIIFTQKILTDEILLEDAKNVIMQDLESSLNQAERDKTYNILSDHDKQIVDRAKGIEWTVYPEGELQLESDVPETRVKSIQEEISSSYKSSPKEEPSFFNTTFPHLNPIDVISLELYNICDKFLNKVYSGTNNIGLGVEGNLQNKIEILNPNISFNQLETDYTRLMGMRTMVAKHTFMDNPYEQWVEALTLLDSDAASQQDIDAITGEPGTKGEILPQFLIDTLNGSLASERETRWLDTIRASMTPSSESNATLFAPGGEHIPHLCNYLSMEGYTITKLDFSDKSTEHHNS